MSTKSLFRQLLSPSAAGILLILLLLAAQASKTQAAGAGGAAAVVEDDEEEDEEEERRFDRAAMEEEDDDPPAPPPSKGSSKAAAKDSGFDEDEFEGFEEPPQQRKQAAKEEVPKAQQKIVQKIPPKPKELKDFYPEIGALICIFLYGCNYIYGWLTNRSIANKYLNICRGVLEENFALIGIGDSKRFESDSANTYKLYLSGRLNCESASITIDLKPRQDCISLLVDFFVKPFAEDTVTIEVFPGSSPETGGAMEKFCMAVVPKNDENKFRQDNKDVESSIIVRKFKTGLHESLLCISDEEEVSRDLVPESVVDIINANKQYMRLMHFSDRMLVGVGSGRRPMPCLKLVFNLLPQDRASAKEGGAEKSLDEKLRVGEIFLRVALRYIDKVTTYPLSNAARERLKKVQSQMAEIEFRKTRARRDAEAQQRKLDKLQKEKEAMEGRSEAEQAKYEEKMRKKQMKKSIAAKSVKMK